MNYKISNNHLTVEISDRGAELQSIKGSDGTEYLWQGDPKYWSDRAHFHREKTSSRIWRISLI